MRSIHEHVGAGHDGSIPPPHLTATLADPCAGHAGVGGGLPRASAGATEAEMGKWMTVLGPDHTLPGACATKVPEPSLSCEQ